MSSVRTKSKSRSDTSNSILRMPIADLRVISWPRCVGLIGPFHAVAGLAMAIGCALNSTAAAQSFPSKPFTIIVPGAPGGAPDVLARAVGGQLTKQFGQQAIVENRPGASGKIAAQTMLRAPRDGYTLLSVTPAIMSVIPLADRAPGYDPIVDIQPITLAARSPVVVVAHPGAPAKTLIEAIAYARKNPGKLSYASAGNTTSTNLAFTQLVALLDLSVTHIPFSGEGPAIASILGGQVDLMIASGVIKPHIEAGRLVAIATTGAQRWAILPNVPTVREVGPPEVANYAYGITLGLVTGAGVPQDIVAKLHEAIAAALSVEETRSTLERQGYEIVGVGPAEFGAAVRTDLDQNRKLFASGRIKLE